MPVYELLNRLIKYAPDTSLRFKIYASHLQVEEYEKEWKDYDYVGFRAYNVSDISCGMDFLEIELEVDSL